MRKVEVLVRQAERDVLVIGAIHSALTSMECLHELRCSVNNVPMKIDFGADIERLTGALLLLGGDRRTER